MKTIEAVVRVDSDPIKGSRFRAVAAPVADEAAARALLANIAAESPEANHHCWAWRFARPAIERAGDDGEPSGSAGRPILTQIAGRDLVAVAVIVTRWFGGTKLGVGGLVRAYGGAAALALDAATVVSWQARIEVTIVHDHHDTAAVEQTLRTFGVIEIETLWTESVHRRVSVADEAVTAVAERLADATSGRAEVLTSAKPDGA